MTKLRILLVQGHRNTSGGNPAETAITPHAARAIQRALTAAGHTADMLQSDNNWFAGSLDAVGREVVRRHDANPYDLMLDIHFEGDANNTRGVFAIVPDGDGLRSGALRSSGDSWEINPLDVRYAEAIARGVANTTGLRIRGGMRRPGVMSEKQTGVGGQGFRLAMFAYTAMVRHNLVRLVLELGNIRGDADIIQAPGFYDRAAAGVVQGIAAVFSPANVVEMNEPTPAKVPPFGTITQLSKTVEVKVAVDELNARKWAETDQPVMRVLRHGNTFYARSWIVGESVAGNPIWWVMGKGNNTDLRWRVWSGGTHMTMQQILALKKKETA